MDRLANGRWVNFCQFLVVTSLQHSLLIKPKQGTAYMPTHQLKVAVPHSQVWSDCPIYFLRDQSSDKLISCLYSKSNTRTSKFSTQDLLTLQTFLACQGL